MQQGPSAAETEEFMSVAAHDLRNPIAVVRASAQMAQRQINRGDTPGALSRLKGIIDQTDRLTEPTGPLDAVRGAALDEDALAAQGYGHERLDQLVTELLLGIR